jgi:predicted pyridoxine 5'-phosphate oxidase superfamily flavin-nucleotide-binding protein
MTVLTQEARHVVEGQRLGFVATVNADGTPNLSPKGTVAVLDDEHLVFADIRSPRTIANLRGNPAIEINVVDPISRKGYRFRGRATLVEHGPRFEEIQAFYRARESTYPIETYVVVDLERAEPVISPAYDDGTSEEEIRARWRR